MVIGHPVLQLYITRWLIKIPSKQQTLRERRCCLMNITLINKSAGYHIVFHEVTVLSKFSKAVNSYNTVFHEDTVLVYSYKLCKLFTIFVCEIRI